MNFQSNPSSGTIGARDFTYFSRIGSEVAPLWGALAYAGVSMPPGVGGPPGSPLSEPLLFGIGGGIGLGYFVYESGDYSSLFLATRITTAESGQAGLLPDILTRLGLPFRALTASTPAAAEKKLLAELALGRPVVAYLDARRLPYLASPATYHSVLVLGFDPERRVYWVADRVTQALPIQADLLQAARQGEGAPKTRALVVESALHHGAGGSVAAEKLRAAVRQGLEAGMAQLRHGFGPPNFRGNFGLMGLEKWG
ncbi:MAG TPA: BtrH N-terminal domain-containing protein, partial [Anaerolineales bacterium]|nr:BtrH N-terminal domain-containing protein [Anaerolineales bacterium]